MRIPEVEETLYMRWSEEMQAWNCGDAKMRKFEVYEMQSRVCEILKRGCETRNDRGTVVVWNSENLEDEMDEVSSIVVQERAKKKLDNLDWLWAVEKGREHWCSYICNLNQ